MHGRCFAVLLGAALAATACGKAIDSGAGGGVADAGGDDGGDGDDGDGDGADGGDDDGEPDDGGDDGEGDAAPPDETRGIVRVFSANYVDGGNAVQSASIEALFGDHQTESCGLELADGECSVLSCSDRTPASPRPHAGPIVITVETEGVAELEPGPDGIYPRFERNGDELFDIGSNLVATASGGDIPTFEVAGTAPAGIAFDGGVPTSEVAIDVSAAAPYALKWTPATDAARLRVRIAPVDDVAQRLVLTCSIAASTGDLVIPAGLLSLLPLGAHQLEAHVVTEVMDTAGEYQITLAGERPALDLASGNWARGTINVIP